MRIDSSGNVQIGNSTYGSGLGQLRVVNDASSTPASISLMGYGNVTDNAEVGKLEFAMQQSGTAGQVHAKISALASGTGEDEGQLAFYTSDNTLTERMRIDENGNVGIGTGSPTAELHVQVGAGETATLNLNNSDGNGTLSQINLGYTADPDHGNIKYTGDIIFSNAGNTERMRITFGGIVTGKECRYHRCCLD